MFVLAAFSERYSIIDVVCFYDWITSFIYPAPWNAVKCAYLFCRYYPLATVPFHIWGFLGNHNHHVCKSYYHALYACAIPTLLFTLLSALSSVILMLRTYAFSGRKKWVLAVLSIVLLSFVIVTIWVMSKELSLTLMFLTVNRTGCFAVSDLQPASNNGGAKAAQSTFNYRLGILATLFDGINMFIMVRRCIQERGTLGSLSQRFVKQGILVYAVMTVLNALTLGTFFSSGVLQDVKGLGPWLAVLMLRRAASPTETDPRTENSHIINEAFEMTTEVKSKSFHSTTSTDGQAQP
ncbi:hypothetical protein V8E53_006879 [Lactarius tabidus]